jgi:AraC-like DNA-binding protein
MHTVVREFMSDARRAALPHPESQIVIRLGPMARDGVDLHAMGAREHVHRKFVRSGMQVVMARLPLGSVATVLGVSAAVIAGKIVPLEDLWGAPARKLRDRVSAARDLSEAGTILEQAITQRMTSGIRTTFVVAAANRLVDASVRTVAEELDVSERQFRRVFRDVIGLSPKSFARVARFHRALQAARRGDNWSRIAASTGYCDQAHLIDEFRAIAGTTPRAFIAELAEAVD